MKRFYLLLSLLLALGFSCIPTEPVDDGQALFYPLSIGNLWDYSRTFTLDGDTVATSEIERELTGYELRFERLYVVEESRETQTAFGETDEYTTWVRYRQDRSGLYEADVAIGEPPNLIGVDPETKNKRQDIALASNKYFEDRLLARMDLRDQHPGMREALLRNLEIHRKIRDAARSLTQAMTAPTVGGPKPGEITRLRYPLRRGQSWVIRDDPFFGATVERRELLVLPAGRMFAWGVRLDSEFFGADDEVFLWFNRCGRLALFAHIEGMAYDEYGNEIGIFVTEDSEQLESVDLVGRPQCER